MSRVFRRPMFRGGSTNMNGIMSGIEDRENYATGSAREQLEKIAEQYPDQGVSPLNQFLIQGGLALMSQPSTGSLLGDIATAAKQPTAQLLQDLSARGQLKKKLALEGAAIDIEQAGKEKLLQQKLDAQKKLAEMELGEEGLFSTKDFFEEYGSKVQAENRKDYENLGLESKANEAFGQSYEGFIGGKHGRLSDYEKKGNIGKVYYDVTDGIFKRLRKTAEGYEYEPLDLATFDLEADKSKKIPKEKFSGERSENPSYRRPPKEFNIKEVDPFDPYSGA